MTTTQKEALRLHALCISFGANVRASYRKGGAARREAIAIRQEAEGCYNAVLSMLSQEQRAEIAAILNRNSK